MEIIKKGQIPKSTLVQKCPYCNTFFNYSSKDIKVEDFREGCFVYCPYCGRMVYISRNDFYDK